MTESPEPRFSMQSLVPAKIITPPGGLLRAVTEERQASLVDTTDLLSHTRLIKTLTVNGKVTVNVFETAAST